MSILITCINCDCIQIQHLLKLNTARINVPLILFDIQIQHLLKLNRCSTISKCWSMEIQIQHLLKLNTEENINETEVKKFKYNTC